MFNIGDKVINQNENDNLVETVQNIDIENNHIQINGVWWYLSHAKIVFKLYGV
jgi:hypothetical protein